MYPHQSDSSISSRYRKLSLARKSWFHNVVPNSGFDQWKVEEAKLKITLIDTHVCRSIEVGSHAVEKKQFLFYLYLLLVGYRYTTLPLSESAHLRFQVHSEE